MFRPSGKPSRLSCLRADAVALGALAVLAAAGCSAKSEFAQAHGRETEAKPVQVEVVRKDAIRRAVDVIGTLAPVDQVTISSQADGEVRKILADLGDRVTAGQVLVQLDNEKPQYTLDQQQAAFSRALAQYGAADADHLPELDKTSDVRRANADLVQATQSYDRASELFKQTLISQQAFDDAKAALNSKRAMYDTAIQNAKNLRASIQAAEASVKMAARQLRDTEIRAPFDGYVEKRIVNPGEFVKAQMPVMSIVRLNPLKVVGEIPEKMVPWVNAGQPAELRVDAYQDRTFTARVSRISPAVNASTRAFPFEALVPNEPAVLKPGTFARVHIESGKVDQILTLPYAALQYRYGVNRVFVVDAGKLSARELKVGERLGDRIEIVSGVKEGDRVAATDVETLADGTAVSVK
jgi:multidrug efflux pump subunit AcrA (membrane-fusion protein)